MYKGYQDVSNWYHELSNGQENVWMTSSLESKSGLYCRFIAGPTLNNSKKKLIFFWKLSLNVVDFFGFFGNCQLMFLKM